VTEYGGKFFLSGNPLKRKILLVILIAFTMQTTCWAESGTKVSFSWALIHRDKKGTTSIDASKNPVVFSGDFLHIIINPKNTHVYIYYHDSSDDLSCLYPSSAKDHKITGTIYIPSEKDWFKFDQHTGIETFYILASKQRLQNLERITREYLNASPNGKVKLKAKLLLEIQDLRKANSNLATTAEKPVPVAGSFRGISNTVGIATEVEADNFYGKTIRIEHQ
jgi:hypothetical protein